MKEALFTERLSLTLVKRSDLEDIHELHSLPKTDKYNTLGIPEDIEQTSRILISWIRQCEVSQCSEYT